MKRINTIRYTALLAAIFLSASVLMAQNTQNEEAQKKAQAEMEMQKALQAEKQAQMEKEMQERKKMLQEQQEQMKIMEIQMADETRDREREVRDLYRAGIVSTGVLPDAGAYVITGWGQDSQSQLTLRKTFRGTTNTSKGTFDVESEIRHLRCVISGSVRSGEIVIGVEYPDGKPFKELVINSSADVNFSQSISIKEGEEKKYVGSWSYVIKADKAEGNYMLQIMTN